MTDERFPATPSPESPSNSSPATSAEPKPQGLFAGLSQIEAQKLWAQGQTLAALSLALQHPARGIVARLTQDGRKLCRVSRTGKGENRLLRAPVTRI